MPKSARPKTSRATTHQPRVAGKKSGSLSPKHRGYRPAEEALRPPRSSAGAPTSAQPTARPPTARAASAPARMPRRPRATRPTAAPTGRPTPATTASAPPATPTARSATSATAPNARATADRPKRDLTRIVPSETRRPPDPATRAGRPRRDSDDRQRRFDERAKPSAPTVRPASSKVATRTARAATPPSTPTAPSARAAPVDDVVLERLEAAIVTAPEDVEGVTFADLGLGANIVRELGELGRNAAVPDPGRDHPRCPRRPRRARPRPHRLRQDHRVRRTARRAPPAPSRPAACKRAMGRSPRALILAPTRELALQIDRTVQPIARSVGLFTTQVYGGVPQAPPGRRAAPRRRHHHRHPRPHRGPRSSRATSTSPTCRIVVLDEADHMCDLGFLEPVQRILRMTKPTARSCCSRRRSTRGSRRSSTSSSSNPSVHEVAGEDQASGTIDHRVLVIEQRDKRAIVGPARRTATARRSSSPAPARSPRSSPSSSTTPASPRSACTATSTRPSARATSSG